MVGTYEAMEEKVDVPVWDIPTRAFHWLLVVAVSLAWATAEESGPAFALHKLAGYTIGGALIFRLIWGFVGSPHSRFDDFIRPWRHVVAHARLLLRLQAPRNVGHNAIGGWMIVTLMADLTVIVATGLFSATRRLAGPFADAIAPASARAFAEVHEIAFNVLLVLVTVHVLGVAIDMVLNRENLVRAMWTGRKRLDANVARTERQFAPLWWAIIAAFLGLVAMAWLAF